MGRIIPADELVDCGFISRTLPKENFQQRVLELAEEAAQFSSEAIRVTKELVRSPEERAILHTVNNNEMDRLTVLVNSKDSHDAIMKFVSKSF
jgi:peroxisomal 3,2-trans-enoyl-CoA isomerase